MLALEWLNVLGYLILGLLFSKVLVRLASKPVIVIHFGSHSLLKTTDNHALLFDFVTLLLTSLLKVLIFIRNSLNFRN